MNNEIVSEFSERMITLPDGRAGLRGTLQVEVREADAHAAPVLEFISSDETLDRYGEIIAASGWRLENYRRNPVFQNAHQYGDVIFTLGRALITEVREGGGTKATGGTKGTSFLYQKIEFATDVNPMARIAYGLYKGKFLNAVSVGFIPLRWVNGDEKSECRMTNDEVGAKETVERESVTALERGSVGGFRRKYIEQELLEVSAVGIPANPNALALGLKAGAVEKSDLRELQELLRQTLGGARQEENWQPVPIKVKRPGKKENEVAELLRLAREVRDLLKA